MTQDEYIAWRTSDPCSRRARFLHSELDAITIMGVPTGRVVDRYIEGIVRYIEGIVISSENRTFPIGYVSFAWCGETFEFVEGTISFTPKTI